MCTTHVCKWYIFLSKFGWKFNFLFQKTPKISFWTLPDFRPPCFSCWVPHFFLAKHLPYGQHQKLSMIPTLNKQSWFSPQDWIPDQTHLYTLPSASVWKLWGKIDPCLQHFCLLQKRWARCQLPQIFNEILQLLVLGYFQLLEQGIKDSEFVSHW